MTANAPKLHQLEIHSRIAGIAVAMLAFYDDTSARDIQRRITEDMINKREDAVIYHGHYGRSITVRPCDISHVMFSTGEMEQQLECDFAVANAKGKAKNQAIIDKMFPQAPPAADTDPRQLTPEEVARLPESVRNAQQQ